ILLGFYSITQNDAREKVLAEELTNLTLKTHPDEAKIHAMAGDFYYRDQNLEKAKDQYLKTIELDKSKYLVWSQLLIITGELKQFSEMAELSNRALDLFPSQPSFYFFNGLA